MIPNERGVYILVIRLDSTASLPILGGLVLRPATYLYVGSAGGPGGLRARITRHTRRRKRVRWHIDHLTSSAGARVEAAVYSTCTWGTAAEAALIECLSSSGLHVVKGFGSTDDPRVGGHLVVSDSVNNAIEASYECLSRLLRGCDPTIHWFS